MTVRFAKEFASSTNFGAFTALLFRWRGSVYKLIWVEYLVFIVSYAAISLLYRLGLNETQRRFFEKIVNYCEMSGGSVEMSFVLGFFVTSIVAKWWQLYTFIPWPEPVALNVNAHIQGQEESVVLLRKTILRYCVLYLMLTFRHVSVPLKRKHPTLDCLVREGYLLEKERLILDGLIRKARYPPDWLPITWAADLVMKARADGLISNDVASQRILDELDNFRQSCILILEYEHSFVPLVYIQVVTISVYSYFLSCLFGSQWLEHDNKLMNLDLYFPFFTSLKFLFYMGWLKVAESLINPFGDDDDDFELEEILHRHLSVSYMMVDGNDNFTSTDVTSPYHHEIHHGFAEFPLLVPTKDRKDPYTTAPTYISPPSANGNGVRPDKGAKEAGDAENSPL